MPIMERVAYLIGCSFLGKTEDETKDCARNTSLPSTSKCQSIPVVFPSPS